MRYAPILFLFLTACTDRTPSADDGDITGASSPDTDPTDAQPTGDDTLQVPTEDTAAGLCGPCRTLIEGDVSPSGNAMLDGFLVAADRTIAAVRTVEGEFAADVRALAEIYDVPDDPDIAALVPSLIAAIQADHATHLDSFRVFHVPSRCAANLDVAVLAQRECEAAAGCTVQPLDGRPAARCEGLCDGACDSACDGAGACAVRLISDPCDGACLGACSLQTGGLCAGDCVGTCEGACGLFDGQGRCIGPCDGVCHGNCVTDTPTDCVGDCAGACLVDPGSAQCVGDVACHGACAGACAGDCAGRVVPFAAAVDCPVSADCQAQATVRGDADLQCTPPLLTQTLTFALGVDAAAHAAFLARRSVLLRRGATILQGAARLSALLDGEVDGQLLWTPSPLAHLSASLQGIISIGVDESFGLSPSRVPCVVPALQTAVAALADTAADVAPTLAAQAEFAVFLTVDL